MSTEILAPCQCGCGGDAGLWTRGRTAQGIKKGDPKKFINGHSRRGKVTEPEDRFWPKVNKDAPNGCWEWTGSCSSQGYGTFWDGGRVRGTHRVSYEFANGPIAEGLDVLHTCDNPPCVNPDHLWLGTDTDNARDRKEKGRNGVLQGEARPTAKLTEKDVLDIRASRASNRNLAERFDVHISTIWRIRQRKDWTHI